MSKIIPGTPQWENICLRCGLCCLVKYVDNLGAVHLTNIRCDMLDAKTGNCKCYSADVNKRDNGIDTCLNHNGASLHWGTLYNDYVVPGCCAYVQQFGKHELVKKCANKPDINLEDTIPESEVPQSEYSKHVIPGSKKYFKYNPEVNRILHENCQTLLK